MSARYLPLAVPAGHAGTVRVRSVGLVAAAVLRAGEALPALGALTATTEQTIAIEAGDGEIELALIGVARGTPAQPLEVTLAVEAEGADGDSEGGGGGGCAALGREGDGGGFWVAGGLAAIAGLVRRRRGRRSAASHRLTVRAVAR